MSRPWFTDSRAGSTPQTLPIRSSFVPTRHRTQPDIIVTIPPEYLQRGRGRGRGRGRRGVGLPRQNAVDTFDISEKTDELGVTSQEEESEKQESDKTNHVTAYDDIPVEATGHDIPPHVTSFDEMGFSTKALIDNIRRCKYVKPTPIQSYAIPVAMAGRDLMACAQTGSGKTAAFCFPIINGVIDIQRKKRFVKYSAASGVACPAALILAPTRELSSQVL